MTDLETYRGTTVWSSSPFNFLNIYVFLVHVFSSLDFYWPETAISLWRNSETLTDPQHKQYSTDYFEIITR